MTRDGFIFMITVFAVLGLLCKLREWKKWQKDGHPDGSFLDYLQRGGNPESQAVVESEATTTAPATTEMVVTTETAGPIHRG